MDITILGGDARLNALAALLRSEGRQAACASDAETAKTLIPTSRLVVTQYPAKMDTDMETILSLAPDSARICLCGPGHWPEDGRVIDLWKDEALLQENAYLTAEGALSASMRAGQRSIRGLNCVVIGWGRIGSALAELLVAMGARVTVASGTEEHRKRALARGAQAIPMEKLNAVLSGAGLVFSTPPAMVLDGERLRHVNREAMLIDLASPPYGMDLKAAWRLGLRAWREPGLPGRYCPESAARAILKAMKRGRVL